MKLGALKPKFVLVGMGAILVAMIILSFTLGRYAISADELLRALTGGEVDAAVTSVLWRIRLPRILLACMVGASLAVAGASYQAVFQNPMAAPDLLGASHGAAFGAALGIIMGGGHTVVAGCAFCSSLLTIGLVYLIGQRARGKKTVNLVLSGVMVSSLFSAATSYIKLVADPGDELPAITYWLMGSLSGAKLNTVAFAAIPMAIGIGTLFLLRWRMNLLTLDEDEARTMGVRTDLLRLAVVLCSTLITAAAVSVSGLIGWVGLVIPHMSRKLIGCDYRTLIPCSGLFGAAFLLMTDNVSRNLAATEVPIGILTAFIGAPFFLYLMTRQGGGRS